jgi:hypothetical protein
MAGALRESEAGEVFSEDDLQGLLTSFEFEGAVVLNLFKI